MDLIEFDPLSTADPKTDSAGIFGGKVAKVVADRSYKAGSGTVSLCFACTHSLTLLQSCLSMHSHSFTLTDGEMVLILILSHFHTLIMY